MPKTNKTRYALMGMLSIRPMSGYDIKQTIQGSIGYFWNESFGQIYPMLRQLVAEGLATRQTKSQKGKLDRYMYSLTERGAEELRAWLVLPAEPDMVRSEFLLKFFFGREVPVPLNLEHIKLEKEKCTRELKILAGIEDALKTRLTENPGAIYRLMTVSYGKHSLQATIAWCDETMEVLKQHQPKSKKLNSGLGKPSKKDPQP